MGLNDLSCKVLEDENCLVQKKVHTLNVLFETYIFLSLSTGKTNTKVVALKA
jgi:hypothetical protein